jgi:predicted Zn finger-like uncharacterized protein
MKFVCERCHTKYSIADEKVRGKVLKVRCKTCANVITVRETGATIDDAAAAGPREAPVSLSGSFDAGDSDTVVSSRAVLGARSGARSREALPAAALLAPGAPVIAPPRRPGPLVAPPPPPPVDGVEWYLAVDGAQTGPFSRSRLIDKVIGVPVGADVHVWNADLDAWKPPKDVVEVQAELTRRRRLPTPVPPPPLRRPTASVPIAAAIDGLFGPASQSAPGLAAIDLGSEGVSLPRTGQHHPGPQRKNGLGQTGPTADGAKEAFSSFGVEDLLGGTDAGATPPPVGSNGSAAVGASALRDALAMMTPAPVIAQTSGAIRLTAGTAKGKQVKLLLGAAAVLIVLCGIVFISMFKKPGGPTAVAVTSPSPAPPADFAGLAEKLAREEAAKTEAANVNPIVAPTPVIDTRTVVARLDPPLKGGKKSRRKSTAPPPMGAAAPVASGAGLTAEQRAAASRFGESSGRELKVPTATASSSHTTPAQGDITRVINNNRQGIQTCYQRALLRDPSLTHGKVTVRVSIGLSGKVKSVSLDAPAQFRALEPCIRDVMSRWAFPPSSEEYGTEFPVVLQGNQ